MDSITHILNLFNSINTNSFLISAFTSSFDHFKHLHSLPDSISDLLNTDELIFHLSQANSHLENISNYLDKEVSNTLKKEISNLYKKLPSTGIPYADFSVDGMPAFVPPPTTKSFSQLNQERLANELPAFKPVNRRSKCLSYLGDCPYCGAPNDYVYDNNNGGGQFKCKACSNTFTDKTTISDKITIACPHCHSQLSIHHERSQYDVLVCQNKKCSFYLENKQKVKNNDFQDLLTSSGQLKLRYTYREFKFNLDTLKASCESLDSTVNIAKIHFPKRVLGLILTYYINYGLSSRKTALILKEVHGVSISRQTVLNYASSVSKITKRFVDEYPYKLSSTLAGDETYVDVLGKEHYVFFFSDPNTKIITSYDISSTRNTLDACRAIYHSLSHYEKLPDDLSIITDGNPIYTAALLFFKMNNINFDLHQVIGLSNKDEISKKYRPFKQIEERLNRTYKMNYHGTNGYQSLRCANEYMVLFTCFFNFLRRHSALNYKTPVDDGLFDNDELMPDKWLHIIDLASELNVFNKMTIN